MHVKFTCMSNVNVITENIKNIYRNQLKNLQRRVVILTGSSTRNGSSKTKAVSSDFGKKELKKLIFQN